MATAINPSSLVAVPVDNLDSAGATVWWRLAGEITHSALKAEIARDDDNGRIWVPSATEAETALRCAVAVLRGKRRLVRPLKRGSYAVVEEWLEGEENLSHKQGMIVSLDKVGRCVVKNAQSSTTEDDVKRAYAFYLDHLTSDDISKWLISLVERIGAVSLRERGGIYYVPPMAMRTLRRAIAILHAVAPNYSVYVMPTIQLTADGARAILDSLTAEIDAEASKLRGELISGELGARALRTRENDSRALAGKVHEYEQLLGVPMSRLTDILGQLEVDAAAAALAAEAEAEEQS